MIGVSTAVVTITDSTPIITLYLSSIIAAIVVVIIDAAAVDAIAVAVAVAVTVTATADYIIICIP
jgi:hypothetical protein